MIIRRLATPAIAALALSACFYPFKHKGNDEYEPQEPITVRVTNHNWSDVVIYATRTGVRYRLGDVTTGREAVFRLPRELLTASDLRLLVDPIGSNSYFQTEVLLVSPGQEVHLTVENQISTSSWTIALALPAASPRAAA